MPVGSYRFYTGVSAFFEMATSDALSSETRARPPASTFRTVGESVGVSLPACHLHLYPTSQPTIGSTDDAGRATPP